MQDKHYIKKQLSKGKLVVQMELKKEELGNLKGLNKKEYEYLVEELMLNDLEANILKMRIQDKSIVEMSLDKNISTASVSRIIKKIKNKIERLL